jgi:hypothetical protein
MRRIDPRLAARGFLGMVVYHFLIQELFGGRRYQKFGTRQVCRTLAQIWLAGMRPSQKQPGRRRRFRAVATLAAERNRDFRARRASMREGG